MEWHDGSLQMQKQPEILCPVNRNSQLRDMGISNEDMQHARIEFTQLLMSSVWRKNTDFNMRNWDFIFDGGYMMERTARWRAESAQNK